MSRSVVGNIRKTSTMLKDIADGEGDLTKRLVVKSTDEIGEMSEYFNHFLEKIGQLIGEVIENANTLNQATQEVLASIEESNTQMLEVAASVETVNDNIQNSASVSEEALASIQEISGQAQMIFSEAQNANDNGEKVLKAAKVGENSVNDAVLAINTVKDSSSEVMDVIGELKRASNEIGKIVSLITQITEQTSLLSLNASIEAARAGDAGKGFAVVANEVKKLSEESKKSANQITSIVDEIQTKMQATDKIISKEQNYIISSSDQVFQTSKEFQSILTHIQGISHKIKSMNDAAQQQSNITRDMTTAVLTLSEGLQENAATSSQISEAVHNQADIYKEIETNMENIKSISDRLKGQTERFKI
ncbi:methyl-accepting chemotaxis protein [Bacillus massilinigeriensis]